MNIRDQIARMSDAPDPISSALPAPETTAPLDGEHIAASLNTLANILLIEQPEPFSPHGWPDFLRALAERLPALLKDGERLDWLDRQAAATWSGVTRSGIAWEVATHDLECDDVRQAIDDCSKAILAASDAGEGT